ncbi:hypothetical protein [Acinetobacter johnsonii]|uniref:Uncharacterized protein n=1 Tax=Acinetobacter johnsonii TaxID=40214 RepID=A0A380TXW6_ACIJO|nr:hypothetical protein [Acinetobacter johnsonii]ENU40569.1 hypothetical protein F986_00696 [Acinetobacter johnsonii CIP 64.6]QPS02478.1 hypothetical protein I6G67_09390 [Acinetobacter johnsonii]SUT92767.1 Uncharacterised protein [Acinetobacter johnsonii]
MEQIRPFPPTDLIDQAEEEEAIRIAPAVELKEWVIKNGFVAQSFEMQSAPN